MDQSSTASRTSPGLYATTRRLSSIMSARYRPRSGSGRFSSSMSRLDGNPGFALGIMTLLSCACRSGAFLAWPGPCPASLCAGAHQRSTPVLPASSRSRLSCQVSEASALMVNVVLRDRNTVKRIDCKTNVHRIAGRRTAKYVVITRIISMLYSYHS